MSISISAYNPVLLGKSVIVTENLATRASSYSHTIGADIGYDSMDMTMSVKANELIDWSRNGLARHMEVSSRAGSVIWEGFVNQIDVSVGGVSFSIGPLMDISNRVYVTYTYKKWVPWGVPFGGEQRTTDAANDTDSQAIYGILAEYYSGGDGVVADMEALRDTVLAYKANTTNSDIQIDFDSGSFPEITLNCLGYYYYLDRYHYTNATIAEQGLSDKIEEVLTGDPNSIISSNYDNVTLNSLAVTEESVDNKPAAGIIKELVALGDTSGNRYIFGVWKDRRVYYRAISTQLDYVYNAGRGIPHISKSDTAGRVHAWDVVPDKWLFLADIESVTDIPTSYYSLLAHPMAVYMDSVTFTMPNTLTIASGPTSRFKQRIKRMGTGII